MNIIAVKKRFLAWLWHDQLQALPFPWCLLRTVVRYISVIARDLSNGEHGLRAMSLSYVSLLSLVPLLAVSFAMLKAFGVHNQMKPLLLALLQPLGDQGELIATTVIGFVDHAQVGVLGLIGLVFLFYTVITLLGKIELALNFTWHVQHRRPLNRRIFDMLGLLVIGPLLMFSASTAVATSTRWVMTGWLPGHETFSAVYSIGGGLLPTLLMTVVVTMIYLYIPNTRVRVFPALLGAVIAVLAWQSVGWFFATFVVKAGQYTAIYSAFAALMLFLLWMYLSWLILLFGSSIGFYYQHSQYLTASSIPRRLNRQASEELMLSVLVLVGRSFYTDDKICWTVDELAASLQAPLEAVRALVQDLLEQNVLVIVVGLPCLLPARSFETLSVCQILQLYRQSHGPDYATHALRCPDAVNQVMHDFVLGMETALQSRSLKDLCLQQ